MNESVILISTSLKLRKIFDIMRPTRFAQGVPSLESQTAATEAVHVNRDTELPRIGQLTLPLGSKCALKSASSVSSETINKALHLREESGELKE